MKKYKFLIPLFLLGGLCACEEDAPTYMEVSNENYTRAFIKEFGLINPKHDWGFGRNGQGSRGADPNETNWKSPPGVKPWEHDAVMAYLQRNLADIETVESISYTDFFLTQVGHNEQMYTALNNDEFLGYKMMNELMVGEREGANVENMSEEYWAHSNDFNAGNNTDFYGNMAMYDSGTFDFAYHNTRDNGYHDRYIIVPGWAVDFRLRSYYYLCFDFEAHHGTTTEYDITYKIGESGTEQVVNNLSVEGAYSHANAIPTDAPDDVIIPALKAKIGYEGDDIVIVNKVFRQHQMSNSYVKADNKYDDWVVRICGDAIRSDDPRIPSYPHDDADTRRIFVEDLSIFAQSNISSGSSDWDFNDLVFDARFEDLDTDGTPDAVTIVLRELGGMLPIYIADRDYVDYVRNGGAPRGKRTGEIHETYFHVPYNKIINTGVFAEMDPVQIPYADLEGFNFDFAGRDYESIGIIVEKDGLTYVMEAPVGQAPSKICVPSYLAAPRECVHIKDVYDQFSNYVSTREPFWQQAFSKDNKPY